jgi:hypothetical protein
MKNRLSIRILQVFALLPLSFVLFQCELILGDSSLVNVGIDLSEFLGNGSRSVSSPYTVTEIRVSVFGAGMTPIAMVIPPDFAQRTINLYVPAGEDRRFTVELFIVPDAAHPHVLSYKGRAIADLRPGRFTGLKIRMEAGATTLVFADNNTGGTNTGWIWEGISLSSGVFNQHSFGLGSRFRPNDLDISSNGRVFVTEEYNGAIRGADTIDGGNPVGLASANPLAIAMDRDLNYDIDHNGTIDENVLYYCDSNLLYYAVIDGAPTSFQFTTNSNQITSVRGMAVDPWTHYLYLVGQTGGSSPSEAIMIFDPLYYSPGNPPTRGQVVKIVTDPLRFKELWDIIVKDDGVFVLNDVTPSDTAIPILLKYDSNLNYLAGFGTISSVTTPKPAIVPSTAAGKFYRPKRFFAQENDGLYIIDDSNLSDGSNGDYDKLIYINSDLDPASWRTFPASQVSGDPSGESFVFFNS